MLSKKEVFENGIEAWEKVYEIIKKSRNNFEFLNNISKNLPELYDFVKNFDIENVEIDKNGNKCYGYLYGKRFIRRYDEFLNELKVKKNKKSNLIKKEKYLEIGE